MFRLFSALFTSLLLCGCDQREMLRKMTPSEDYVLARTFMTQVVAGDNAKAAESLVSKLRKDEALKELEELTSLFKHGEVKSVEVVGLFFRGGYKAGEASKTTSLTLQMELSTGWFAGSVDTVQEGAVRKVAGAYL